MYRLVYSTIAIIFFFTAQRAAAQDSLRKGVVIHADPRLAVLLRKNHTTEPIGEQTSMPPVPPATRAYATPTAARPHVVTYKGPGYRVQIYNGTDRAKALEIKSEFMRHYPGVHAYLNYIAPAFRVRVGDYRNRDAAASMLREARDTYRPCMIVPDMVTATNY